MNVLLVEDDAGIGRVVCNGLRANGFEVDWIRSAESLFRNIKTKNYAVIVLDLMLPGDNGFEVCAQLRRTGITIPVCMLTARDALEDKLEGFRVGADDYLTKPFAIDELVARLRAVVRRVSNTSGGPQLSYKNLQIDLLSREVCIGGILLDLTPREFDLLVLFAQNPDQVITRERLMQLVWSDTEAITPNATDVYVGYLRRKMRAAAETPVIQTVRGVGFKLA